MASLCLLDENGAIARRWELGDKTFTVGRSLSADIVVNDATLSRHHFLIERKGADYLLKDLQSQNGTWVDGRRADAAPLRHHDCILAGRTLFMFAAQPVATADATLPVVSGITPVAASAAQPNRGVAPPH